MPDEQSGTINIEFPLITNISSEKELSQYPDEINSEKAAEFPLITNIPSEKELSQLSNEKNSNIKYLEIIKDLSHKLENAFKVYENCEKQLKESQLRTNKLLSELSPQKLENEPLGNTTHNHYKSEQVEKENLRQMLIEKDSLIVNMSENLDQTMEKIKNQNDYIEELIEKLNEKQKDYGATRKSTEESQSTDRESSLLSKIKYQHDVITELENKNIELESRFNRIRNKNNTLESSTKKYSENVGKVFNDINKKLMVIEKNILAKEEKIQTIFQDYNKFKNKYISNFREKTRIFIEKLFGTTEKASIGSVGPHTSLESNLDKEEIIKLLKERIDYLEDKLESFVKSNYATKEIIENISDKAHDAIELIRAV